MAQVMVYLLIPVLLVGVVVSSFMLMDRMMIHLVKMFKAGSES